MPHLKRDMLSSSSRGKITQNCISKKKKKYSGILV